MTPVEDLVRRFLDTAFAKKVQANYDNLGAEVARADGDRQPEAANDADDAGPEFCYSLDDSRFTDTHNCSGPFSSSLSRIVRGPPANTCSEPSCQEVTRTFEPAYVLSRFVI
jgi:hypothetical protein